MNMSFSLEEVPVMLGLVNFWSINQTHCNLALNTPRAHRVITDGLTFPCQTQQRLASLEKHLDTPTFAVKTNDFLLRKRTIRGEQNQILFPLPSVTDKNETYRERLKLRLD